MSHHFINKMNNLYNEFRNYFSGFNLTLVNIFFSLNLNIMNTVNTRLKGHLF
jgi:hypothetical protein